MFCRITQHKNPLARHVTVKSNKKEDTDRMPHYYFFFENILALVSCILYNSYSFMR